MRKLLTLALLLLAGPAFGQAITGGGGGGSGGGTPGGSNGQIQFNNSGAFGGLTPAITLACGGNTTGTIGTSLTGTLNQAETVSVQTGANYAFQSTDCGKFLSLSNAANQVPTIGGAGTAGFAAGWYTDACNPNTGTQTITPGAGTIGGAATYVLAAGTAAAPTCVRLVSDATNSDWKLVFPPGGSTAFIPASYKSGNWYTPAPSNPATNGTIVAGSLYCFPGAVLGNAPVTIKSLGVVAATGVASSNVEMAIYSVSATTLTRLDYVAAQQSTAVAGAVPGALNGVTLVLNPGTMYAFCSQGDSNVPNLVILHTSFAASPEAMVGSATMTSVLSTSATGLVGWSLTNTYSTTPSTTFPATIARSGLTDANGVKIPYMTFQVN